jgi:hypothetical protein
MDVIHFGNYVDSVYISRTEESGSMGMDDPNIVLILQPENDHLGPE